MRSTSQRIILVGAFLLIAGCVERTVRMYPDNDAARNLGPLQAQLLGHGNLNGTITLNLPNGHAMQGRYSISLGGEGEGDMMGPQGTTAHCEFLNNNFNGHGHGSCRLSDGSVYRMQY